MIDLGYEPAESYGIGEVRPDGFGRRSEQHIFKFGNGYGASLIRSQYTYGGSAGLWELAVIRWHAQDTWTIAYDTPITDDCIGWLADDSVAELLHRIESLPAR